MAETVTSLQGDTVDIICRRVYGDESGYVEAVLDANPGLAGFGPVLPTGTALVLPDLGGVEPTVPVVTLWD